MQTLECIYKSKSVWLNDEVIFIFAFYITQAKLFQMVILDSENKTLYMSYNFQDAITWHLCWG